ncbi:MAG TPA: hypothetical protein VN927_09005 [Gemmatimonadaceae bacterium]|nr:hypothetical protein [Gemmatimonadaceae bacterium]
MAAIAKGQHFVQAIGKCAVCHGDNFAGKVLFDDNIMGRLYSANLTRGEYLANTGGCRTCHLQDLSGGVPIQKNVLSANLTPKGIGKWTEADFRKALRDGIRPDGRTLSAVMPWAYTRFMTDDETHALWLYVHSVPPKNAQGR